MVDEADEPVATASRQRVHSERLLHRAVHVLLLDDDARLLLQHRSASKRTYPGRWTSSASGHVAAGEAPRKAARREVKEELGITAPTVAFVGTSRFEDDSVGEREIIHVFTGRVEGVDLDPDPGEVQGTRWVPLARVSSLIEASPGRFAPSFVPAFELAADRLRAPEEGA